MITDLRLEALRRGRPSSLKGTLRLPSLRLAVYAAAFALGLLLGWFAAGAR